MSNMGLPILPILLFLCVGSVSLFSFIAVASWSDNRRREREAYYKGETIKKVAESSGEGAAAALAFMREQERIAERRRREGLKVGGVSALAAGVALSIFLGAASHGGAPMTIGFIPAFVGVALLVYSYLLSPKTE